MEYGFTEEQKMIRDLARQIAEEKYDVHKVNAAILDAMGLLAGNEPSSGEYRA